METLSDTAYSHESDSQKPSEETPDYKSMICSNDRCGRAFDKPLELIDLTDPSDKRPSVCPYCLSNLEPTQPEQETVTEAFPLEKLKDVAEQKGEKCPQFIGYLSKRPKNTPIPESCLTCPEMMKCLLGNHL